MVSLVMTSEEKLLQLIRGSRQSKKAGGFRPFFLKALFGGTTDSRWLWINRVLSVIVVMMLAALIGRYQVLRQKYVLPAAAGSAGKLKAQDVPVMALSSRSFDDVRGIFTSRNIFQPSGSPETAVVAEEIAAPAPDFSQMYRIAGIVLGDQPTAIVENIQNATTVFLTVGDSLDNAVVKEIRQDRVILDVDGQIVELKS